MVIKEKNIYSFCIQTWPEIEGVLLDLQQNGDKLKTVYKGDVESLFMYIGLILEELKSSPPIKMEIEKSLVRLLDKELLVQILSGQSLGLVDQISNQIITLAAGLGVVKKITPYDDDELSEIIEGKFTNYDDLIFASTLYGILSSDDPSEGARAGLLRKFLHAVNLNAKYEEDMDWNSAFLLILTLQTIWRNFALLSMENRVFLLKNYLYLGVAAGVPIVEILRYYLFSGEQEAERQVEVSNAIQDNQEYIPINTNFSEWKRMTELIGNFAVQLGGEETSGYKQEEFLQALYAGQVNRDRYRGWLREVLNVVFGLEKSK